MLGEPATTAILLSVLGGLLLVSVLSSRASERTGIPVVLLFLIIGMLAGSEGLGGLEFDDFGFAFRAGTIALVLILFDGGLNTPTHHVRPYWGPSAALATVGVVITAALVGLGAWLLGLAWPLALLLGAVVSSTDAAAVFSVLRGSGLHLARRQGATLELESGLNDPMAILLTLAVTAQILEGQPLNWFATISNAGVQLAVGATAGWLFGIGARAVMLRIRLPATGMYPVFTVAAAFLSFGITSLVNGSGFLAVYITALVIGNAPLPYRSGLLRVHDALAWLSQIGMFLVLGLLVYPSELGSVVGLGLGVSAIMIFVARPVAVAACLLPFRYRPVETAFIGWAGLKGAVPIILATYPVLSGVPGAQYIFNLTFFVVVVSVLVTGGSMPWVTRRLGLDSKEPPGPQAVLEITSTQPLSAELLSFYIQDALDVTGVALSEIPFPPGTSVALILRGGDLVVPQPGTQLEVGDHVYVITPPDARPFVQLLFGRPEEA